MTLRILAAIALVCATAAGAQTAAPDRIVALGGGPSPVGDAAVSALAFAALPPPERVDLAVMSALLRATPVSTLAPGTETPRPPTGALHVLADLVLAADPEGLPRAVLGGEALMLPELAARLAGLAAAVAPAARQTLVLRIADPEDLFPLALADLRAAAGASGAALSLLTVGPDPAACRAAGPPLPLALLAGAADRTNDGNADGTTTLDEAARWLERVLARDAARPACAATFNLILRADLPGDHPLSRHGDTPLSPAVEAALHAEGFEASVLAAAEAPGPIADFLAACHYCPSEDGLRARLADLSAQARTRAMEVSLWDTLRTTEDPERLRVYLATCTLCAFRDDAQARLEAIDAVEAARSAERAALAALRDTPDLTALRDWLATCTACDNRPEAEALVAALEADARNAAEQAALAEALASGNPERLGDWLSACAICDNRATAETRIAELARQTEAAAPCLPLAGTPQLGGPRLLAGIDAATARAVCTAALDELPDNPTVLVLLGRVAAAEGAHAAAADAYARGMTAGVAVAYGLAAQMAMEPPGGTAPADPAEAERLALQGHARGDWLSGEVLATLYAQDRIAGRGAADALAIARPLAEAGSATAAFLTGYFHLNGLGTAAAPAEAARWLAVAAERGDQHAATFLAELLERGAADVPADPARAAELYWGALRAAEPAAVTRFTAQINERGYDVLLEIQTRLRAEGALNARADGLPGPATVAAVRRLAAPPDPAG